MKNLYVVRHAKSDWQHPNLTDHERPLNQRGQTDAPIMGKRMAQGSVRPECIVSSSAVRALTTAQTIGAELGFKANDIVMNSAIYTASVNDLLAIITSFDSRFERIMLVGHNPGLTHLVNQLSDAHIRNMPTSSIAVLEFDTASWLGVQHGSGELITFDFPKNTHFD